MENEAADELAGLVGDEVIDGAAGGILSTVTWMMDESPVLPAESVALDWKVWAPCVSEVAEYVHDAAVPPVETNAPPSTEIVVDERLVSADVPVRAIVVEVE